MNCQTLTFFFPRSLIYFYTFFLFDLERFPLEPNIYRVKYILGKRNYQEMKHLRMIRTLQI